MQKWRGIAARSLTLAICLATGMNPASAQEADGFASCEQAAQTAELTYGLPTGLLAAIGRVESGRRDPASGSVRPWAYTLNANGVGAYWPDRAAALMAVTALQSRGIASIDVGCFQVNLMHHPNAFASLADAFAPSANADYAARFLLELRQRTGNWVSAVMAYHSMTPALGEAYWTQVQASWPQASPNSARAASPVPLVTVDSSVHVWTPSVPGTAPSVMQLSTEGAPLPTIKYFSNQTPVVSTRS